jgi:hypothetical protein
MWHLAKRSNLDLGTHLAPKWLEPFTQLNVTPNKPHPCQREAKKNKRIKVRKSQTLTYGLCHFSKSLT